MTAAPPLGNTFTKEEKKTILQILTHPSAAQEILSMNPYDLTNFLYMALPMLKTQHQTKVINQNIKKVGIASLTVLGLGTLLNVNATPYVIERPFYVKYPARLALFAVPALVAFYTVIKPAMGQLYQVHDNISLRLDRFRISRLPRKFFE